MLDILIHCAAHALNLVINDAVKKRYRVEEFFDMLEKLCVFFSAISIDEIVCRKSALVPLH